MERTTGRKRRGPRPMRMKARAGEKFRRGLAGSIRNEMRGFARRTWRGRCREMPEALRIGMSLLCPGSAVARREPATGRGHKLKTAPGGGRQEMDYRVKSRKTSPLCRNPLPQPLQRSRLRMRTAEIWYSTEKAREVCLSRKTACRLTAQDSSADAEITERTFVTTLSSAPRRKYCDTPRSDPDF